MLIFGFLNSFETMLQFFFVYETIKMYDKLLNHKTNFWT